MQSACGSRFLDPIRDVEGQLARLRHLCTATLRVQGHKQGQGASQDHSRGTHKELHKYFARLKTCFLVTRTTESFECVGEDRVLLREEGPGQTTEQPRIAGLTLLGRSLLTSAYGVKQ